MGPHAMPERCRWHRHCSVKAASSSSRDLCCVTAGHAAHAPLRTMPTPLTDGHGRSTGLVDVLDRVLDKGLVVAGDIKVSLAEVELLTIRIRLLICSIDKAEQIGLDWWK